MPKISVIVPVYNVEPYLHRCVDSILAQTFTDFELILVDDGSPDNCPSICDEYAKKDNRVVVIHQNNGGLSAARNAGIDCSFANSDSEWITFIDSDDWVHKQYLELLYNAAIDANTKISMCIITPTESFYHCSETMDLIFDKVVNKYAYNIYTNKFYCYSCGKLIQKSIMESIRFPNGRLFEDWFTTYKFLFATTHISILKGDMYYYFQHSNSITNSKWSIEKSSIIEALEEQISYFDNIFEHDLSTIAKTYYVRLIYNHYYESIHSDKSCAIELSKHLRKKMRVALFKYKHLLHISVKNNPEYFECAFPKFMFLYWHFIAMKRKFFK